MTKSEPIRGHFYAVKMSKKHRGRVEVWWQWHAEVRQGITLLWADDCRDPQKIIPAFRETVKAFRRLREIGQRFESWSDICGGARL